MGQHLTAIWNWITGLTIGWKGYILGGLIALFLIAQLLTEWQPGFRPFTTYGEVYVDSPEVYTRQRLVNDRYAQDHWLRTKLDNLNDGFQPLGARRSSNSTVKVKGQTETEQQSENPNVDTSSQVSVTAEVEGLNQLMSLHAIEVEASVRTALRQAILENQLDDRHDLSGNSIYGFKFDTTVISGSNTRSRAYIRIRTKITGPNNPDGIEPEAAQEAGNVFARILASLSGTETAGTDDNGYDYDDYLRTSQNIEGADPELREAYQNYRTLYDNWLNDVDKRLDRYAQTLLDVRNIELQSIPDSPLNAMPVIGPVMRNLLLSKEDTDADPAATFQKAADEIKAAQRPADAPESSAAEVQICTANARDYKFIDGSTEAVMLWNVLETILAISKPDVASFNWRAFDTTTDPGTAFQARKAFNPNDWVGEVDLVLKNPWSQFYTIKAKLARSCRWEFEVSKVKDAFYIHRVPANGAQAPQVQPVAQPAANAPPQAKYFTLFGLEAPSTDDASGPSKWSYRVVSKYYGELRTPADFQALQPKYPIDKAPESYFHRLIEQLNGRCTDDPLAPCELRVDLDTGLLTLIQRLIDQDSYAYAVLPKNEVSGLLSDQVRTGFIDLLMQYGGVQVQASEAVSQSQTVAAVVGFSDSSESASDGSIDFGWIFDPSVGGGSMQKSQMALISVPAWDDEIEFEVETGWIDRHGREIGKRSKIFTIAVALPPDFEAFETIIFERGNDTRRQPIVHMDLLPDQEQKVQFKHCIANSVLIPGRRLWRSTKVTLGAHEAAKITVLPNMDGIIATFDKFEPEEVAAMSGAETIRVWTSEGMIQTGHTIQISACDQPDDEDTPSE